MSDWLVWGLSSFVIAELIYWFAPLDIDKCNWGKSKGVVFMGTAFANGLFITVLNNVYTYSPIGWSGYLSGLAWLVVGGTVIAVLFWLNSFRAKKRFWK